MATDGRSARATLERLLAPEILYALDAYIREIAEDIADRRHAQAVFAGGKPWLTVAEAADALGCSQVAVRARARRGRLQSRYQGRRLYIATESILSLGG
jgi:nucleotide-binding universal stress UspA family protein